VELEQEDLAASGVPICGNCDTDSCNEEMELLEDHIIARSAHTRVVTMQVSCMAEDAEEVRASLFHETGRCWFFDHDCPLGLIKVDVRLPTAVEEAKACETLDVHDTRSEADD